MYYGVPPVLFIYLPIYKLFNFIPTDALVMTILSIFYISFISAISLYLLKSSILVGLIFYFGFLFNPIWLYGMNMELKLEQLLFGSRASQHCFRIIRSI